MTENLITSDNWIEEVLNRPETPLFYSAKDMEDYCKKLLNDIEGVVPERCLDFLYDIMEQHPHWNEKVGCGFHHFEVRKGLYGKKGFYIVRTDGTSTDISYRKAIYAYPTKRAEIMKACRTVISPIIEMMRNQIKLPFTCPITGEVVTDRSNVHIDHYDLTFRELFDLWMEDKDVDKVYATLRESRKDGCVEVYFNDPMLAMDFYQFHNEHTHLRPVSATANETILKKK